MIESLTVLLVCQLIGELATRTLQFPVPGPVVGLVLLFIALRLRGSVSDSLRQSAAMLHGHMSLLFVPAGVGVMLYYPLLAREWLLILVSVVASTLIGIGVTAWVLGALVDRKSSDAGGPD